MSLPARAADVAKSIVAIKAPTLGERQTDELVIALVGPIGSGVSETAKLLQAILRDRFDYDPRYIKVSDIIRGARAGEGDTVAESGHARISGLQGAGDQLRSLYGHRYLAEKCIETIALDRVQTGGYQKSNDNLVVVPRRTVHIIDSLKHPSEVEALREVYGETFWIFGIFAPEDVRYARMLSDGVDGDKIQKLMSIDEEEGLKHGQKVRDTIHQADFFIRNDGENDERLRKVLNRYLDILFNIGVNTPTQDETGMYKAMSAASSSACLSRQVGAVIYSQTGELIGVGANDVPKRGGGLYIQDDASADHRCYKWQGRICHNDKRKNDLYEKIFEKLSDEELHLLTPEATLSSIKEVLKKTDIKNLIEYSRAVHAEVESILSVARSHNSGIINGTMYSTTFPCHNCASLIVASGIVSVFYIEPYAKSLALNLHSDAISLRDRDRATHVVFLQYEGVAPKNIIRLFNHGQIRKEGGRVKVRDPRVAPPVFRAALDGFSVREQIIVQHLSAIEAEKKTRNEVAVGKSQSESTARLPLGDQPKAKA
jgi:deoxycytidylate deaminase